MPNRVLSRRTLLGGSGALVVTFALARAGSAQAPVAAQSAPLPGSLKSAPLLDSWIRVDAGGGVTVFTGKCELGQGVKTALAQIAAEQLGVPFDAITLVTSDTARTANEGFTAGSLSLQDSGTAILHACAQAREILLALAAARLNAAPEELRIEAGAIVAPDGRRAPP